MSTATVPQTSNPGTRIEEHRHRPASAPRHVEQRLVARAATDDVDALNRLIGAHRGHLVTVARGITRCPATAEDVVQDALVKIWRTAHRLDPERGFVGWATVVVRRTALDHVRTEARARSLARRAHRAVEASPYDAVDARLDARQATNGLGDAASDDRRLLTWIHVDGESLTRVSERLGVPVGTVKSRSARARARLAGHLPAAA